MGSVRADEGAENAVCKNQQKLRLKRQMRVQYDSKSGYFSAHLPWVRADEPEGETGVQKNRVGRIKAPYQSWAGRTRCYKFHCTVDDWGLYCNISVISN